MIENPGLIAFYVHDLQRRKAAYSWRVWPGGTSFYLKSGDPAFRDTKISLHGPDPDHARPWLKFGRDGGAKPGADTMTAGRASLPISFEGNQITSQARHIIRIRTDWRMFQSHVPSAPEPRSPKKPHVSHALRIKPPDRMHAVDVDFYLCDKRPWWPKEAKARRDDAALASLKNDAGQFLTAVVHHSLVLSHPAPHGLIPPVPPNGTAITRGQAIKAHDGVLWICEAIFDERALQAAHDAEVNETDHTASNVSGRL